jgi:tRNA (guanine37-N1)-methyltransferase
MLMMTEPIALCFEDICSKLQEKPYFVYMSPQGNVLNQQKLIDISSKHKNICVLCGHYEGVDQRVIDELIDEEISIGDYVLTGGEIPAMTLIDSVSRYIDGVITNESTDEESFSNDLLEYPQYTRPECFEGIHVPEVLQSGHHKNIENWRRKESLKVTLKKRPDLLEKANLTEEDKRILEEIKNYIDEN